MSALVVETAEITLTAQQPRLMLVRPTPSCGRIDWLAVSGAMLLALAILLGLGDAVHVFTGGDPLGLGMVALMASLPGLTRWAHRIDRRCGRGGR